MSVNEREREGNQVQLTCEDVAVADDRLAGVQDYVLDAGDSACHLVLALHSIGEPLPLLRHFHDVLLDSAARFADCQPGY